MKRRRKAEAVYVPDGGWGWVIVACSFLIHMFVVGTLYALSVLYVSWLEAFQSGKGITSWIISMAVAVMFGIGPLPGSLSKRFGNRPVVMMGGVMMAVGFFVSSFAMNVYFLIVTVGIITGVGAGCCYLPSVALVAQYFSSKRSLAMGISASGLGVGAFFMAPFMNWLVEYFGWRGTLQILSGISLNMCVLASLMRPLELAPHCRNCRWIDESEWTSEQYQLDSVALVTSDGENGDGDNDNDDDDDDDSDRGKNSKFNENGCGSRRGEGRSPFSCACGRPNQSGFRAFDANTHMSPINYFPSPTFIQNTFVVLRPDCRISPKGNAVLQQATALKSSDVVSATNNSIQTKAYTKSVPLLESAIKCDCPITQKAILKLPIGGSLENIDVGAVPMITRLRRSFTFSHIPSPLVRTVKHVHYNNDNEEEDVVGNTGKMSSLYPAVYCSDGKYDSAVTLSSTSVVVDGEFDDDTDIVSGQCQEFVSGNGDVDVDGGGGDDGDENVNEQRQRRLTDREISTRTPNLSLNLQFCCSLKYIQSAAVYLKLMRSGLFMVFCISNFLTNLSFLMPVLYMVDRAIDAGIGKSEAAMLVSLYGTGNIFGKVFFGWLADRKLLDRLLYYIFCLSMCGAATCVSPLCGSSHTLHGLYAFTFGCFIGAYCTLFPLVTVDLVGMSVVEESFGMLLCFMGTATAFGTPLAGWMFDFTGSYTWAFFLHGAFIIVSALMLIPVFIKKKQASIK